MTIPAWAPSPALLAVADERRRQEVLWGDRSHLPDETGEAGRLSIATAARAACQRAFEGRRGSWAYILNEEFCEALAEKDPARLREELVQLAAVCVAWVEAIDSRPAFGAWNPDGVPS